MRHQRTPPRPVPPEQIALGRAVRLRRAYRGISQEELGFRARLHRNYVGAVERGEINPTLRTLLKLARGLGIAMSELIAFYEEIVAGEGR
jgi:transcriptional regulator with XRE-family HTH domain